MTQDRFIAPEHMDWLEKAAIPADKAAGLGIWSVTGPNDLRGTGLEYLADRVPGITGCMFTLRQVDGSYTYQMRVDERHVTPDGADAAFVVRKYVQEAGVGAIINVPDSRAHLLDITEKVLIVEGTKQTLAASLYAPADVLVVGIQGARNWSKDGIPLEVLSRIIRPGREVYLCFDADWTTNPDVWAGAKYLSDYAASLGASQVKLMQVPGGGKLGLDDFLGTLGEPSLRPETIKSLMASGRKGVGRKPARPRATNAVARDESVTVDVARGVIVKKVTSPEGAVSEEVALNVAAEIVASEAHVDEDTGDASNQVLTLKVYVPFAGEGDNALSIRTFNVKVPSSKLADVGTWLDRLPHGFGVSIPRKSKPDDDVANAIRSFSTNIRPITVVSHTGWTFDEADEVWRWCDGTGAIGAYDKVERLHGNPGSEDFKAIRLPEPPEVVNDSGDLDPVQAAKQRAAVREFILMRDCFNDVAKFNWEVGLAGWALAFLGVTPNAAICFFGPPASGKSTIAQAIAASLNEAWAPRTGSAMATFNARPAGMDLLPDGLDHCFLHVDDLKPEADPQSMKNALKAFDALLRRAHGSGGAVRGTIDKTQDRLAVRKVDDAAPLMIITGEEIPTGDGFAESGLDRALFISIQPNTQLRSMEALATLEQAAASGRFKMATTAYLSWIAAQINSETPVLTETGETMPLQPPRARFASWKSSVEGRRQTFVTGDTEEGITSVDEVFPVGSKVSNRARMLTASLLLGMEKLLDFAVDVEALSDEEAEAIWDNFCLGLRNSVLRHTSEVMGGNMTASDRALAQLRSLISSRKVTVEPLEAEHRTLIGQVMDDIADAGRGALALNHIAAAEALRYPGGSRALLRDLADVIVVDERRSKTRTLKIGGNRTQVCIIPGETWNGFDDSMQGSVPASVGDEF